MAKEHVVKYKDDRLGDVNLDVNNGIVYDQAGNQVAKWSVTDQKYSKMLADFGAVEMHEAMCAGIEAPVRFGPKATEQSKYDAERAKAVRMSYERERAVTMDIGVADVHQAMPLSNYAAGYRNEPPMADQYAPPIPSAQVSAKFYTFAKEDAFQRAQPTVGATAAAVNEVLPRIANQTFTTVEYALGGFVGTQLEASADAPLRIRQATMRRVLDALLLEREIRVATLATTAANWDTSVVTSIAAGAKWNGGVSSQPITDIHNQMRASFGPVSGIIMPEPVFHAFQENANVQKYIQFKSGVAPLPDAKALAAILELPPIYVAKMKYLNSAGALTYVWGTSAVLFRQPPQMPPQNQDDVASACTFRWNGTNYTDGQTTAGLTVREYFVPDRGTGGGNKVVAIHQDAEQQTSKFVGGLLSGAYQ